MRLVLTGGTGLLGRYISRVAAERGHSVTLLTRTAQPVPRGAAQSATVAVTDYSERDLRTTFDGADVVVHLAASRSASPQLEEHLPSLVLADRVFRIAAETTPAVAFASTISVYGAARLPWHETDRTASVRPYGVLKAAAESLGEGVLAGSSTTFLALRYGHLYGAHEVNDYLVNKLRRQAYAGEDLVLNAPGVRRRDFVYAHDAAVMTLDAMEQGKAGRFNIGSGDPVTNEELAHAIVRGTRSRSRVVIADPTATERHPETMMSMTTTEAALSGVLHTPHDAAFAQIALDEGEL